jgi:hypothetical protein
VGGRYFGRKPLMGCLFHGSTSAAVLDAMPSLNVHQQTLHKALAVDPWREHSIFVTHNDPNTKKPKVNMKEVPFALRIQQHTRTTHTHTHTHIGKEAMDLLVLLRSKCEQPQPDPRLILSLTIQRAVASAQLWAF